MEALEIFKDYIETNLADKAYSTRNKYIRIARRYLIKNKGIIDLEIINKYLATQYKKVNCNTDRFALRHLMISAGIPTDKLIKLKKKSRKKIFKYQEPEKVARIINRLKPMHRYMALIQYKGGGRFQEVATLRAENIDYNGMERLMRLGVGYGKGKSKGSVEGYIMLSKKYESLFKKIIGRPYGYVFLPRAWEHFDEARLERSLSSLNKRYNAELRKEGLKEGITGFSSHYLRHLFGDNFILNGGTIPELQKLMRHKRIDSTLEYESVLRGMAETKLADMEEGRCK